MSVPTLFPAAVSKIFNTTLRPPDSGSSALTYKTDTSGAGLGGASTSGSLGGSSPSGSGGGPSSSGPARSAEATGATAAGPRPAAGVSSSGGGAPLPDRPGPLPGGGTTIGLTKGTITLATRRSGADVEVRFADTGCGIPEAARTSLEHLVPKAQGPLFTDLLSQLARDAVRKNFSDDAPPTLEELLAAGDGKSRSRPKPR